MVGPRADKWLRAMGDYLKARKHLSFHAEITVDEVLPSGQKIQLGGAADAALRRPDRLYSEFRGDADAKRFWYDGKRVTLLDGRHHVYAQVDAPGKVDAALDQIMERAGFAPPLADLLFSDPYKTLSSNVVYGFYVGLHEVGGRRAHHLAFVEKYIDWQVWIQDGTRPVPVKVVITYKTMPGSPQFTALLSEWDFTTELAEIVFQPDVPETASRIAFREVGPGAGKTGAKPKGAKSKGAK